MATKKALSAIAAASFAAGVGAGKAKLPDPPPPGVTIELYRKADGSPLPCQYNLTTRTECTYRPCGDGGLEVESCAKPKKR